MGQAAGAWGRLSSLQLNDLPGHAHAAALPTPAPPRHAPHCPTGTEAWPGLQHSGRHTPRLSRSRLGILHPERSRGGGRSAAGREKRSTHSHPGSGRGGGGGGGPRAPCSPASSTSVPPNTSCRARRATAQQQCLRGGATSSPSRCTPPPTFPRASRPRTWTLRCLTAQGMQSTLGVCSLLRIAGGWGRGGRGRAQPAGERSACFPV